MCSINAGHHAAATLLYGKLTCLVSGRRADLTKGSLHILAVFFRQLPSVLLLVEQPSPLLLTLRVAGLF